MAKATTNKATKVEAKEVVKGTVLNLGAKRQALQVQCIDTKDNNKVICTGTVRELEIMLNVDYAIIYDKVKNGKLYKKQYKFEKLA